MYFTERLQLEDEISTEGFDITDWNVNISGLEHTNNISIHLWDFGGQEIYHSTHQFFLTTRSIYLYVLETRRDESLDDFYYWLNIIKLLGGNNPVIVVVNKSYQPTDSYDLREFSRFNENVKKLIDSLQYCFGPLTISFFKSLIMKINTSFNYSSFPLLTVYGIRQKTSFYDSDISFI